MRSETTLQKTFQANFVVLVMPLLERLKIKTALGSVIADLVLQILSLLAEEERGRIRKRSHECIDLALEIGIQFGRQTVLASEKFKWVYRK